MSIGILLQTFCYILMIAGELFNNFTITSIGYYIFMFSFATSLGGVLFIYKAELLPPKLNFLSGILAPIPSFSISYFTLSFIDNFGLVELYMLFFIISLIGWVLFEILSIETKGKTDTQIIKEFQFK